MLNLCVVYSKLGDHVSAKKKAKEAILEISS